MAMGQYWLDETKAFQIDLKYFQKVATEFKILPDAFSQA